jgi:hypothetical protein
MKKVMIIYMASFVTQTTIVLLVTYSTELPCMAILPLSYMTIVHMGLILQLRPFKSTVKTYLELFNLCTQLALCYLLLLFTDYVDTDVQQMAGNWFVYVFLTNIAGNLAIYGLPVRDRAVLKVRRFWYQAKLKSKREKLRQKRKLEMEKQAKLRAIRLLVEGEEIVQE